MVQTNTNLPVAQAPLAKVRIGDKDLEALVTQTWRRFFENLWTKFGNAATGWSAPTGVGSRGAIDMNWTTTVSNPPTQAEVTSVRDQVVHLQKALGQLIDDQIEIGTIDT